MKISTSYSIVIPKPRKEVFDFCCRNDTFERHLQPRLPVAGVQRAEFFEGDSLAVGGRRNIGLTDGSLLTPRDLIEEGSGGNFAKLVCSFGTGAGDEFSVDMA